MPCLQVETLFKYFIVHNVFQEQNSVDPETTAC